MSLDERIAYAERKRDDAVVNDTVTAVVYWNGYLDGLKALKRDQNNERN